MDNVSESTDKEHELQEKEPGSGREAIQLILRTHWKALDPTSRTSMEVPVKQVYYTETDTKTCYSRKECIAVLKGLQEYNMELQGMTDIAYHFLIGGDGNIYEGRGWYTAGREYPKNYRIPQNMTGKCLEIAFIGTFKDNDPSIEMREAANSLISYGLENKLLDENESAENESDQAPQDVTTESVRSVNNTITQDTAAGKKT